MVFFGMSHWFLSSAVYLPMQGINDVSSVYIHGDVAAKAIYFDE